MFLVLILTLSSLVIAMALELDDIGHLSDDNFISIKKYLHRVDGYAEGNWLRDATIALHTLGASQSTVMDGRAMVEAIVAGNQGHSGNFLLESAVAMRWLHPIEQLGNERRLQEFAQLVDRLSVRYPEKERHWRMIYLMRHRLFLAEDRAYEAAYSRHQLRHASKIDHDGDEQLAEWSLAGLRVAYVDATLAQHPKGPGRQAAAVQLLHEVSGDEQLIPHREEILRALLKAMPDDKTILAAEADRLFAQEGELMAAPVDDDITAPVVSRWWLWALAGLGAVVIMAGAVWVMRLRRS